MYMGLQVGEFIGPYRIVGPLGQGGMATVYKAYHPELDRHVAIKIMNASLSEDPNFLSRFEREAKIIARLEHPNIVPIYHFSRFNDEPYLVMKYVEVQTLKAQMSSPSASFDQLLKNFESIADGLAYAHEQGVLHRDVKPSNILVDHSHRAYITDFGLARLVQAGQSTLSQDMLMGTPHYISPEQARGSQNLGPGADIYSFAVILYEWVVGRVPFSRDTPYAIVHDHIYTPLPLPSTINPAIKPDLEMVLLKALSKEPEDRYLTAAELFRAFKAAITSTGLREMADNASPAVIIIESPIGKETQLSSATPIVSIPLPLPRERVPVQTYRAANAPKPKSGQWITYLTLIVIVGIVILLVLASQRRETPTNSPPLPTLAVLSPTLSPSSITLIDIPELSLSDAQAAVQNNPNDPAAHLALGRAYWLQSQMTPGIEAINAGAILAPEQGIYWLSAAQMTETLGEIGGAVRLNMQALFVTPPDSPLYPQIRAAVGEYIYNTALNPQAINLEQVKNFGLSGWEDNELYDIMVIRSLISGYRLLLAEGAIRRMRAETNFAAEYHLVRGELFKAQDDITHARAEWALIATLQDVPGWINNRVTELLSLSGV